MPGFKYLINLQIVQANSLDRAIERAEKFDRAVDGVTESLDRATAAGERMERRTGGVFGRMTSGVRGFIATLGVAAFTLSSISTNAQNSSFDRAITFAGGKEGAENLAFVNKQIDAFALPVAAAKEGFKTLSGAMMGTGITATQQRDIFTGMAEASTVMGLSSERSQLAFLALGQMASKGYVKMEELTGQLGEQMPGALAIAARAMGVTNGQLIKMAEDGIEAKTFLPKFAAELHRTFASGVPEALQGAQANLNRFHNSVFLLKDAFGQHLMPTVTQFINVLIPLFGWIGKNLDNIMALASIYGIWWTTLKLASIWSAIYGGLLKANAGVQLLFSGALGRSILMAKIATFFTGGLSGAVTALNAAFWANPIMWVVGILGTLAVAVVYAWNKFEGFRGFLVGMFNAIGRVLMGIGKMVMGLMRGDIMMMADGFNDVGKRANQAFVDGWNEGKGMGKINVMQALGLEQAAPVPFKGGAGSDFYKIGMGSLYSPRKGPFPNPTQPSDAVTSALGGGANPADNAAKNLARGKGKAGMEAITGGGAKNVTIQFHSLQDGDINIHTTNLREGAEQLQELFTRMWLSTLNSANQAQASG